MTSILNIASRFVTEKFKKSVPSGISYHNLTHTLEVAETSKKIGEKCGIEPDEMEMLLLASWFHDIGIIKQYDEHEVKSAELCREFLSKHNYPSNKTKKIVKIIRSTRIPQKPNGLLEKILCDADLAHIGKTKFNARSQLLRNEWENMIGRKYSDLEWIKANIDFIEKNKFHTQYAKLHFNDQRKKNLSQLREKLKRYKITPPPKHKA